MSSATRKNVLTESCVGLTIKTLLVRESLWCVGPPAVRVCMSACLGLRRRGHKKGLGSAREASVTQGREGRRVKRIVDVSGRIRAVRSARRCDWCQPDGVGPKDCFLFRSQRSEEMLRTFRADPTAPARGPSGNVGQRDRQPRLDRGARRHYSELAWCVSVCDGPVKYRLQKELLEQNVFLRSALRDCVRVGLTRVIMASVGGSRVNATAICILSGARGVSNEYGGNYGDLCRYPGTRWGAPNHAGGSLQKFGTTVTWRCSGESQREAAHVPPSAVTAGANTCARVCLGRSGLDCRAEGGWFSIVRPPPKSQTQTPRGSAPPSTMSPVVFSDHGKWLPPRTRPATPAAARAEAIATLNRRKAMPPPSKHSARRGEGAKLIEEPREDETSSCSNGARDATSAASCAIGPGQANVRVEPPFRPSPVRYVKPPYTGSLGCATDRYFKREAPISSNPLGLEATRNAARAIFASSYMRLLFPTRTQIRMRAQRAQFSSRTTRLARSRQQPSCCHLPCATVVKARAGFTVGTTLVGARALAACSDAGDSARSRFSATAFPLDSRCAHPTSRFSILFVSPRR